MAKRGIVVEVRPSEDLWFRYKVMPTKRATPIFLCSRWMRAAGCPKLKKGETRKVRIIIKVEGR